jgi:hypothetical protein
VLFAGVTLSSLGSSYFHLAPDNARLMWDRLPMTIAFISNPDCGRHDTGWGHPEHVGRLRAIPKALREEPELFHRLRHVEARHATADELALAHDPRYVEQVRARTREDVDAAVRRAAQAERTVRAVGAGHSFTDIALTNGHQVSLDAMDAVLDADRDSGLVRVEAGITIHELSRRLWDLGLSLENLGDIDVQSIAGAMPTIVTGDFNDQPGSECYRAMTLGRTSTPSIKLTDTFRVANPTPSRHEGTMHSFGGGTDGPRIDWIFTSGAIQTVAANVDRDRDGWRFPSDHFPVEAVLRLSPIATAQID